MQRGVVPKAAPSYRPPVLALAERIREELAEVARRVVRDYPPERLGGHDALLAYGLALDGEIRRVARLQDDRRKA